MKVGDKIEAKYTGMDRKGRMLQLSIRAKDEDEMQQTLEEYQSASGGTTKLGALLKEQIGTSPSERERSVPMAAGRSTAAVCRHAV